MKKFAGTIFFYTVLTTVTAQQKPQYTQYILNNYILNPALTGIENYFDVKASHRHQWVGLQDAPVTTYLTVQGPIGKKDDRTTATSVPPPGENPRGRAYWENYTAAQPHSGIGLVVVDDHTGPLNNFEAYATYAYHIGISPKTSIAAGFGLGITDISIDRNKLFFETPVDPAVYNSGQINKIRPDFNAGLWLYSADFFAGVSAQQIIPQKVVFADKEVGLQQSQLTPHIFATAGYRFLVDENFNVLPSVMMKYVSPLPLQFDFNLKLQYQDIAWIGASFRTYDGFAAMLGVNISSTVNIGYSYDLTTSRLNTVSNGTHEILVGFLIGNKYGDTCPKNVW
ncbi:MAG: type IX secretion system membrane protein PorP/SprF [Bacteroidetes bacterium]|nr:type IX secretion system membrane protein PorP/SprF [Bacteroidota bacterium]